MKILVTGANGQLGMCLRGVLEGDVLFTDVVEVSGIQTYKLDITDASAVRETVAAHGVDVIVNCAAYTNVEGAEEHPALAELLNAQAVGHLAAAMKEVALVKQFTSLFPSSLIKNENKTFIPGKVSPGTVCSRDHVNLRHHVLFVRQVRQT